MPVARSLLSGAHASTGQRPFVSFAILIALWMCGGFLSASQSDHVVWVTPTLRPASVCVRPSPLRHAFSRAPGVMVLSYSHSSTYGKQDRPLPIAMGPGIVRAMATKSLDDEWNLAAREYVTALVEKDFREPGKKEPHLSKAAAAFGVSQPTLSKFLAGGSGAGIQLLYGVATYANASIDTIIGLRPATTGDLEVCLAYHRRELVDVPAAVTEEAREEAKRASRSPQEWWTWIEERKTASRTRPITAHAGTGEPPRAKPRKDKLKEKKEAARAARDAESTPQKRKAT